MAYSPNFYQDSTGQAATASFVQTILPTEMTHMYIYNDDTSGTNVLLWSFDGSTIHGSLNANQFIFLRGKVGGWNTIWIKYRTGAPAYHIIGEAH